MATQALGLNQNEQKWDRQEFSDLIYCMTPSPESLIDFYFQSRSLVDPTSSGNRSDSPSSLTHRVVDHRSSPRSDPSSEAETDGRVPPESLITVYENSPQIAEKTSSPPPGASSPKPSLPLSTAQPPRKRSLFDLFKKLGLNMLQR